MNYYKSILFAALILTPLSSEAQMLQVIVASTTSAGTGACGATYSHCATFVIPQQSSTLTDFPVEIAGLSEWAVVGSGGQVLNTTTQTGGGASITVPADLIMASDTCITKLPFEWDRYVSATGTSGVLWAKATLSSSTTTTLTGCWGASGVTTYQGDVNGTWNSAYVGVWHMPDGTTLTVADSTTNANNGTKVNTPTATTGKVDGAANLASASGQDITLGTSSSLDPAAVTVSAWINATTFPNAYNAIYNRRNAGAVSGTQFFVKSNGTLAAYVYDVTANSRSYDGTGATLSSGTFYHVTLVYSSAVGLIGYLNASVDGTAASGGNALQTHAGDTTSLGVDLANAGRDFNGVIDEVQVSNVARSADWVSATYNNQLAPASWYAATVIQ